jgi:transketolase
MADVFTALYFAVLNVNPADPWNAERDRVVLSNGHICPVWYATLAQRGFFDVEELTTLRQLGSRLQGHPHVRSLAGIEASSGPLGQGLSQGIGMALAARLDAASWRTHVLLSDGEHDEGQLWEAVMFASKYRLRNLTAWVDRNNIQIGLWYRIAAFAADSSPTTTHPTGRGTRTRTACSTEGDDRRIHVCDRPR